ncbi:NUDIX domain-containing protein [Nonomuraea sp. NPDC059023]|uniref:NUDIX domain-containing protein n=1 Tax=unclassified Nonomuraea TaxID=2593643 RepID=UPI00369790A7
MSNTAARTIFRDLIDQMIPHDAVEASHRQAVLDWVDSGDPLYRTHKPATPPQHLAVYAVPFDEESRSVLLVEHTLAGLWLNPGGHPEVDEDPRQCARRELDEELQITPDFHPDLGDAPLFLTVTPTRGPNSHIDVTTWHVLACNRDILLTPDLREFTRTVWVSIDEQDSWPAGGYDPAFRRFLAKLSSRLAHPTGPNSDALAG